MKLLLYCTKAKNKYDRLVRDEHYGKPFYLYGAITENFESLNGKIVAECDFEVEKITPSTWNVETERRILKGSCLKEHQLFDYIIKGDENESQNPFYAIRIKNLHIFDKPRFIQDYSKNENPYNYIENAPQNIMYAYDVKSFNNFEKKVLISIHPEWLCKILNGEKTIEVRRKVLKEMR